MAETRPQHREAYARCVRMCDAYRRGVPVKEIAADFGVQNPAVWKALRRGGVLPPYTPSTTGTGGRPKGGGIPGYTDTRLAKSAAHIARIEASRPAIPDSRVDRDPCFMCGVRGDIGCIHRSAHP